jgi:DNA-binding XRE family transcriptional regulator
MARPGGRSGLRWSAGDSDQTTNRVQPATKSNRSAPHTFILDGHRLRHLRRQRGLSQEELADQAGISLTTVARLERQLHAPCRGWTLGRLARALGEDAATTTPPAARRPRRLTGLDQKLRSASCLQVVLPAAEFVQRIHQPARRSWGKRASQRAPT